MKWKWAVGAVLAVAAGTAWAGWTITDGQPATDVLGQLDAGGRPIFTKSLPNDGPLNSVFNSPYGVAVDAFHHRLFVSDQENNRVLVFGLDAENRLASRAAQAVLGQPTFTSTAPATTDRGLSNPMGMAYDGVGQRLFVADALNNRVLVFNVASVTNGESAVNVLGQADFVSGASTTLRNGMNIPVNLDYDAGGRRLFVADRFNRRVLVFDVASITNGENAAHVLGQPDFTTRTVAKTQNKMSTAGGVAYDAVRQRLFVADHNRVLVFDVSAVTDGQDAIGVLGQVDFTSGLGNTTRNNVISVEGLAYDAAGRRLFVADSGSNRVLVFDVNSITNGEDAVNVLGQPDFTSFTSTATRQGMRAPGGLFYEEEAQRLFVVDSANHRVLVFDGNAPGVNPMENARGYPSPFRPGRGDTVMTFDLMPGNARVRVYTTTGALVRELRADGGGVATWDVKTSEGRPAASGVYWVVCEGDGGKKTTKVIVQR